MFINYCITNTYYHIFVSVKNWIAYCIAVLSILTKQAARIVVWGTLMQRGNLVIFHSVVVLRCDLSENLHIFRCIIYIFDFDSKRKLIQVYKQSFISAQDSIKVEVRLRTRKVCLLTWLDIFPEIREKCLGKGTQFPVQRSWNLSGKVLPLYFVGNNISIDFVHTSTGKIISVFYAY